MIPLLAGVILMVVSAWAFTKFFLLKQITNKLEAAGLVLEDSSEEKTENAKPKAKISPYGEDKSLGLLINLSSRHGGKDKPKRQKEYEQKQKDKNLMPFETDEFHKPIKVAGVKQVSNSQVCNRHRSAVSSSS